MKPIYKLFFLTVILIGYFHYQSKAQQMEKEEPFDFEIVHINQIITDTSNVVTITFTIHYSEIKEIDKIYLNIETKKDELGILAREISLPFEKADSSVTALKEENGYLKITITGLKNGEFLMTLGLDTKLQGLLSAQKTIKL